MRLYHTAYEEIPQPDVHHGRVNADFGQGFYTTDDQEFARRWAREKKGSTIYVNCYELDLTGLQIYRFGRGQDWSDYLFDNRAGKKDRLPQEDVIIGPIANDTIYDTFGIITSGMLKRSEALRLLQLGPAYTQIVLKTEKAASRLTWLGAIPLKNEDAARYREILKNEQEEYQRQFAQEMELITSEPEEEKALAWEEIRTEHLVTDQYIDFRSSEFRFPDGSTFAPYYNYSRRDYVVIVATDTEGNYLCVRQYRYGIAEVTTEFPAGGIDRTDGKDYGGKNDAGVHENALEAARRELREETGYESDEWQFLLTVPSNATLADNYAHIFRAVNCRKVTGQHLDDTEFLNVKRLTDAQVERLVAQGKFQQAIHVMAWLLAKKQ